MEGLGRRRDLKNVTKASVFHEESEGERAAVGLQTDRFNQQLLAGLPNALERHVHVFLSRQAVHAVVEGVRHGLGHLEREGKQRPKKRPEKY